jgi:D-aminopeptidase
VSDLDLLLLERQVERLLAPWDRPGSPGCTIGVVRDGALILHRSAGLASIELEHPIGPRTTFRIASVTKQFTCAAVLMLANEQRLGLEDDVRKHILELPEVGPRTTITHLMHNTSGLRDMLEIMRLGGTDLSVPCRPEDQLAAICRQRAPNFAPGTRFLYSNTNFLLLGLIVERITGESLAAFLHRRIFAPLGMNATRLAASTTELVPNLATGYLRPGGAWVRAQHGFPLGGEGGLVSSVEDLALWDRNYTTGRVGGPGLAAALETQAPFTNGAINTYARGLEVKSYRGLRTVSHGGLWPGYKTQFLRVPERNLTIICIANNAIADPHQQAHQVLDVVLDGERTPAAPALPPRVALARLTGRYVDRDNLATLELAQAEDGTPTATMYGVPFALAGAGDGRLTARRDAFVFIARPSADGSTVEVEGDAQATSTFHRVTPEATLPGDLAGRYVNAEIGATWRIATRDGKAMLDVAGPLNTITGWEVEPIEGDIIRIIVPSVLYRGWLDARLEREGGRIVGLRVEIGRVRGLLFKREGDA